MASMFSLEGRIAVVTGGGQGNGRAIALGLAGAGAGVAVVDRTSETASATASEIVQAGGRACAFTADVSREEDCRKVAERTGVELGPVSLLVNNAGILL